jgi:hypothetical protein
MGTTSFDQNVAQQLLIAIQTWSSEVLNFAVVLAAIGTITMALLELVKALTLARLWFHKLMIARWVGRKRKRALEQLIILAAGGKAGASGWYNQPDDRLVTTLQAAANVALNYPLSYPDVYELLVSNPSAAVPQGHDDSDIWRDASKLATVPVPTDEHERAEFLALSRQGNEARLRLGNFVQRKIDALASRIDWTWSRLNQGVALIVGVIMTFIFLSQRAAAEQFDLPVRIMFAIVGGLIAPFAKDIVSALSGLGSPKKP